MIFEGGMNLKVVLVAQPVSTGSSGKRNSASVRIQRLNFTSESITKTLLHEVTVVSGVHQKYRSEVVLTKLLDKLRELQKVSEQLRQKSDVMLI